MSKRASKSRNPLPFAKQPEKLLLTALLLAVMLVWWQAWLALRQELRVTFVDVGQGDCIIVHAPTGRTLLIDAGGRSGSSTASEDVGRWMVVPALYREGIQQIDAVIATHPHDDHIGGLAEVIEQVPVGMILDSGQEHSTPTYERFIQAAKTRRVPIHHAQAGQVFNLGAGIKAEVLHPNPPLVQGTEDDLNNNSIVLRLSYGTKSFLFTGDIQKDGQEAMLMELPDIASTVLKVPHHGGMDANLAELLDAVRPNWAVLCVGRRNPFGHPHDESMKALKANNVQVFRTDEMGTIVMRTNGRELTAEWQRKGRSKSVALEQLN